MSANPLTYLELEAFERKTLNRFSAWQTDLIMALDDAALRARHPATEPAPAPDPAKIPVKDTRRIRAMLEGLAAQKPQPKT